MSRCYVACLAALIVHGQSDCDRPVLIGVRVANVLFLFMMKMSSSTTWTYFVSFWCRIECVVDEVQLNCQWYIKKCMHKKTPLFRKQALFSFYFPSFSEKDIFKKSVYEKCGELVEK